MVRGPLVPVALPVGTLVGILPFRDCSTLLMGVKSAPGPPRLPPPKTLAPLASFPSPFPPDWHLRFLVVLYSVAIKWGQCPGPPCPDPTESRACTVRPFCLTAPTLRTDSAVWAEGSTQAPVSCLGTQHKIKLSADGSQGWCNAQADAVGHLMFLSHVPYPEHLARSHGYGAIRWLPLTPEDTGSISTSHLATGQDWCLPGAASPPPFLPPSTLQN